ncbi:MAG: GIY-YIG nuclease family protein [Flavihumibacter sp.]
MKKLCTVRLARKLLPGQPGYSLGTLCRNQGIGIENRHRALGDAAATARLFERLISADNGQALSQMLRGKNAEQFLPPHLPADCLANLPDAPGVYYFENQKKEVVYVGKAISLKKRVRSHFSNNDGSRRKQELLRQVHNIRFTTCCSELMALILESQEIKRLWPVFNRSQKRFQHRFGLYRYEDNRGYIRLAIEKRRKCLQAIYTFDSMPEGINYLRKLTPETQPAEEPAALHNHRLEKAIEAVIQNLPSFVLLEKDLLQPRQWAAYLLEKGKFWGMGYVCEPEMVPAQVEEWKQLLEPSSDNDYIRGLLYQFATKKSILRLDLQG